MANIMTNPSWRNVGPAAPAGGDTGNAQAAARVTTTAKTGPGIHSGSTIGGATGTSSATDTGTGAGTAYADCAGSETANGEQDVLRLLAELDAELIGLAPVKRRIREIAALLVVDMARRRHGLKVGAPGLHMSFTGNPGTGKTTVAMRMASILHRLGYVRKGHLVAVTRDDLVGQYIGHTAPKTKEVLKKAMGGVLFIDEAYTLYRPENERDYGQESIEILLQIMENRRDDLVVIMAGYDDRMQTFFECNPGFSSRIAHHIDFPDYDDDELARIAQRMLDEIGYRFSPDAGRAFARYVEQRRQRPHFANARSVRNAIDRARMRQAGRLFGNIAQADARTLSSIEAEDILASRVFGDENRGAADETS
ncbi:MAG: CbbX protein [Burkholderiaceae bacterium]